jgi:phage N-6-adenine-methyltransferase
VSADPRYMRKNVADRPDGWDSDQWATPWQIVRDLEREFGFFDLDPCAQPATAKAPKFFTPVDDGLGLSWFGKVFMNPPYSMPGAWCKKAHEEVTSGSAELVVALIPASTDTRWFHEWVKGRAEIRYVRGRVRFLGWEGTPIPAPKAPSIIAVYRRPTLRT